jgi:hypothetical protein
MYSPPIATRNPEIEMKQLKQAFEVLTAAGMNPTWVGGDYVIANVPGIEYLPGGKTKPFTSPEIVRSLSAAHRLINACN